MRYAGDPSIPQPETRAAEFVQEGMPATDAFHLAAAEAANADYFCTCDDRLLRRAKRIAGLRTVAVSPLELLEVLDT